MYSENQISQLGSCIKEVIATAIGKFTAMGLLKAAIYPGQMGGNTTWLTSPAEQQSKIEEAL